mmetsp:Transcript_548/g.1228  ORF Transcript_548/g.1228 Transcript_548/m.1228 type:complete len:631 (-) Transcript_548:146-2038(-)
MGRSDTEVAPGMVYAHLSRMRTMVRESERMNDSTDEDIERQGEGSELALMVGRVLETLSGFGFAMPQAGRVPVRYDGMKELIQTLESEFRYLVDNGKAAASSGGPVEYMALQELYPIGTVVTTDGMGGLGGTVVAFRVDDCYYEPMRSIFGGRKYSFRTILETVVAMAGEFVSVRFEVMWEEYTGAREQSMLALKVLKPSDTRLRGELTKRAEVLSKLVGLDHAYMKYRAGCFFPKLSSKTFGGASSGDRQAAPGRLIVDTKRGLELGHAPAAAADDVGSAIALETKKLRTVQRALSGDATDKQRQERLQCNGLRMWRTLPKHVSLLCWPTAVAFSLTLKQWGFVLVDGLEECERSRDAWDQLVLPERTKEMLLAMASSTQRADAHPPRYRFRDIVDEKGGGCLFLLYGPPGTGKTLSVEALASAFGRPLYTLSFAELGSTVAELEERLTDVLALAAHWGALVLLDEGDALVERRQRGQLLLNSMTGVLLRLLETFDGALFITSNRASSFDPAALSRVTLAVRYEPLDLAAKRAVWENTLARVLMFEDGAPRTRAEALALVAKTFTLDALAKFTGSGRSVGAVVRLAVGLCQQRGNGELTQAALDDAIEVWSGFHKDLRSEGADQHGSIE